MQTAFRVESRPGIRLPRLWGCGVGSIEPPLRVRPAVAPVAAERTERRQSAVSRPARDRPRIDIEEASELGSDLCRLRGQRDGRGSQGRRGTLPARERSLLRRPAPPPEFDQ
jgi:hypothetical protein